MARRDGTIVFSWISINSNCAAAVWLENTFYFCALCTKTISRVNILNCNELSAHIMHLIWSNRKQQVPPPTLPSHKTTLETFIRVENSNKFHVCHYEIYEFNSNYIYANIIVHRDGRPKHGKTWCTFALHINTFTVQCKRWAILKVHARSYNFQICCTILRGYKKMFLLCVNQTR